VTGLSAVALVVLIAYAAELATRLLPGLSWQAD
jgi:hypothetical protein